MKTTFIPDNTGLYLNRSLTRAKTTLSRGMPQLPDQEITVQPMTKRRRHIFQGKENIDRKKIFQMIEDGDPSGLELLNRVSNSPTEYQDLIHLAYEEFCEWKRLQNEAILTKLKELKRREPEILKQTESQEKILQEKQNERDYLLSSINTGKLKLKEISGQADQLAELLESDKRKVSDFEPHEIYARRFFDDKTQSIEVRVANYIRERERLEKIFDEKEKILENLNQEIQTLCRMKTRYKPPS